MDVLLLLLLDGGGARCDEDDEEEEGKEVVVVVVALVVEAEEETSPFSRITDSDDDPDGIDVDSTLLLVVSFSSALLFPPETPETPACTLTEAVL